MSLKERSYRVLVVSAAEKLNTALSSLLAESQYDPVLVVSNVSAAKRAWGEQEYDFVIINSPLPDDPGIRLAIDLSASQGTVVLLFVRAELHEDIFEEKMEEIRLVNRAKWLLISELKMDEPQAHRYIEKQAMDRCIQRREVAEEIIQTYS